VHVLCGMCGFLCSFMRVYVVFCYNSQQTDIRDLISVDEVMDELSYGPNGGLVYAMEYLIENISWFLDEIDDFGEDYLIIDCPGQVELYSHVPLMRTLAEALQRANYLVCGIFLLDSHFLTDTPKFISGALACLSAMVRLELPHINILTKVDLMTAKQRKSYSFSKYLDLDILSLIAELDEETGNRFHGLNHAIGSLLEDYNMVSFLPLDITDEESISAILLHVDTSIQYGEDLDIPEPKYDDLDDDINIFADEDHKGDD